ncbi:terminase small subunit-like protein [Paraburkholderia megapolitana]|uniref:terminase small subunit-like protein n=1 Tax=Paraburkholderia megapolitana TaxID=420953 RepID=UPI0038BA6F5A
MNTSTLERRMLGRRFYPSPVVDSILGLVKAGRTISEITSDPAMPCAASWFKWCADDQGLRQRYDEARAAACATTTTLQGA